MKDGADVENRLSSQHDENSNIYSIQEEITEVKFDDTISLPRNFCEKPPEDSPEKIILDPLYIISTGDTNNPINDNTNENNENNDDIDSDNHNTNEKNENNKDINSDNHNQNKNNDDIDSDNHNQNENNENNKDINSDNHNINENKENNKDINSDNHNQIIQNTIINKKRKRNIISEEKKKNMGRKKKDFYDDSTKDSCGDPTHTKYSEDNVVKKNVRGFKNFCWTYPNDLLKKKDLYLALYLAHIKNIKRERFNRDFYLKLFHSKIEDYLSKEISSKYTINREPNEETIKILKKKYPELKDFFEQTFIDGLKKYTNGYYDSMYENPADNKYLYCQLKTDEKEKQIWERLINEDLYKYFWNKKGRKTIDEED
jgi:hypothetical protein